MSSVPDSPVRGPCSNCEASLLWDGTLRNNKGKMIPFEEDYRIHDCRPESRDLTEEEKDMRAVKYLLYRMHKLNRGLKTCQMTLVLNFEDGTKKTVDSIEPEKLKEKPSPSKQEQPLTPMQRLLINSRL